MTDRLRLVIFDVDGTLVDSQLDILAAMTRAFDGAGLPVPDRDAILGIVGLSLDAAMLRLVPDQPQDARRDLVERYKQGFMQRRAQLGAGHAPLYPGATDVLRQLAQDPFTLLGVATGKSRRGLDQLVSAHGWEQTFVTRQVADDHPSKPHPSMILEAMAQTGVEPADTVMIGDTQFDMEMAAAAGVAGVGVSWGYHPTTALGAARRVIDRFEQLPAALQDIWMTAQ